MCFALCEANILQTEKLMFEVTYDAKCLATKRAVIHLIDRNYIVAFRREGTTYDDNDTTIEETCNRTTAAGKTRGKNII